MQKREDLKVSTRVLYDELIRQDIPVRIIDASLSMLEYKDADDTPHFLFSTTSDKSSAVGHIIANNKLRTELIAKELAISVPKDTVCYSLSDALTFFKEHGTVVLKPLANSGGTGVTTNISDETSLRRAYSYALRYGKKVIAQQHITGTDIRLLIVAGTFRSAIERRSATVTGDGVHTIEELVAQENRSPARSSDYMTTLSQINAESVRRYLSDRITSIPRASEVVNVIGPANLSLGGTAHEATTIVPNEMIADAEHISRYLGIDLCGVDMMWDQTTNRYYLIEINATPGIDMHNDPYWNTKSNAIEKYVHWLCDPTARMSSVI